MKQILQDLKTGETLVAEVPSPKIKHGHLKIKTNLSLISAGTEGMLVEFGRSNYIEKARQQPDKVAQVMSKISTDGLLATVDTVRTRLDEPQPLGYSNVGKIIEVGPDCAGFSVGDRVVSNGRHAEIVNVPQHLCAKIPDDVSDEMAAFTIISSIGLQGVRLAQPTLGETFVVFGLGLIGMLTAQILRANGCRVLGFDINDERIEMARTFGIEAANAGHNDAISIAMDFTNGVGVDAVVITASTKDHSIVSTAAKMARKRGRIVLIGVVGLNLNRSDFYEKELSFQVSCSYGPGRYDPFYEEQGNDYPIGFVRWTEQRNFYSILNMMSEGKLLVEPLISMRVPLEKAASAYEKLVNGNVVTIIMNYPNAIKFNSNTISTSPPKAKDSSNNISKIPTVAVIGAGNFTKARLLPALRKTNSLLHTIASNQGLSSASGALKYKFLNNTNNLDTIWNNNDIDTLFVTTRHDLHFSMVSKALQTNKNVFVEKPLCLTKSELSEIRKIYLKKRETSNIRLMVGFNRRFAPLAQKIKFNLENRLKPVSIIYTVNAGHIADDHWTHDIAIGGGRIIGEACHFIDLMQYLIGYRVTSIYSMAINETSKKLASSDTVSINLQFDDGSQGVVHYFANGSKVFPKERIEVFSEGRVFQLDNFRKLNIFGDKLITPFRISNFKPSFSGQNKGHEAGFKAFLESIRLNTDCPISFEDIENTMLATFAAVEFIETGVQKKLSNEG